MGTIRAQFLGCTKLIHVGTEFDRLGTYFDTSAKRSNRCFPVAEVMLGFMLKEAKKGKLFRLLGKRSRIKRSLKTRTR